MKTKRLLAGALAVALASSCSCENASVGVDFLDDSMTNGDTYGQMTESPFVDVSSQPVSTFSIDADGASYANMRRYVMQENQLPPSDAVRTEEFINYFNLNYDFNNEGHPIDVNGEISQCPWNTDNKLVRIGIKGEPLKVNQVPSSNFVFLIDVSGSMSDPDKLDLLKEGFIDFVDQLDASDRVSIVTYAGTDKILLEPTPGDEKNKIKKAINKLGSGGGTNGAEGINTAYELAEEAFIEGGNNRIIVGTDGDFNIGPSSQSEIVSLIEEKRETGVFLTVLGVGRGNLNDWALEQMANNGNGVYEYIDNVKQLQKVFLYDSYKFFTAAKDVKVQIEFNLAHVSSYRLIGYENRVLSSEDFTNDEKDAGEIGAGQSITALYEIVPTNNHDLRDYPALTIDLRYKAPDSDVSVPMSYDIETNTATFSASSDYMKFTAAVAAYSMLIRGSEYSGTSSYDNVLEWLDQSNLDDPFQFKSEFRTIVEKASSL